ncbi:DUF962 domain-containing protein [Azohydromonas sediminis]|uniref:Mpo1 family 2-hydroxy fatty acid dioxygenase n=1 Tax=Azohydromonas sediminis TaxID=2259674 RepID=UPI000E64CFEB|nr:Mpo1-like protein [Azohydromonas sediminis]
MSSLFRPGTELMVQYAGYHRDRRNIATHFVGIPLIVFAVGVLLARPTVPVAGLALTPAWVLWALAAAWYVSRGPGLLGVAVAAVTAVLVALAQPLGAGTTTAWLAWGAGCFVAGWLVQFVGHLYEGRRPAFFDDLVGLLVGPMFVVAEALFAFGRLRQLAAEIERQVGPTMLRDLHHQPAAR